MGPGASEKQINNASCAELHIVKFQVRLTIPWDSGEASRHLSRMAQIFSWICTVRPALIAQTVFWAIITALN